MKKVLIVDDEGDLSSLLARFCKKNDIEAHVSDSVKNALELLNEYQPNIAILDYNLEDGVGTELINPIKKVNEDCKIYMFTAYTSAVKKHIHESKHLIKVFEKPNGIKEIKRILSS